MVGAVTNEAILLGVTTHSPPPHTHTHTVSLDEGNVVFGDWVAGKLEPYVKLGYIKVQRI